MFPLSLLYEYLRTTKQIFNLASVQFSAQVYVSSPTGRFKGRTDDFFFFIVVTVGFLRLLLNVCEMNSFSFSV